MLKETSRDKKKPYFTFLPTYHYDITNDEDLPLLLSHHTKVNYISNEKTINPKAKWAKYFSYEINGINYLIDPRLSNIISSIKSSLYILELEEGWDGEDAVRCTNTTYNNAVEFLIKYSQTLFKNYDIVIRNPEINLCRDGSIDFEWRSDQLILLINVTNKDNIDIHYYSEDLKSKTILKGFLDNLEPNENLVFWMQKLK